MVTSQIRGNVINSDMMLHTSRKLRVMGDDGKPIGYVDHTDLGNLIQKVAAANPAGGIYAQIGAGPTLAATTQRLVKQTLNVQAGNSFINTRGVVELFVYDSQVTGGNDVYEHYAVHYSVGKTTAIGAFYDLKLTMVSGMATTGASYLPIVNSFILGSNSTTSTAVLELQVVFAANPATKIFGCGAQLYWTQNTANLSKLTLASFDETPPVLGWAAAGTLNPLITLSTNNGTNAYTFACIGTHSAAQTSFL